MVDAGTPTLLHVPRVLVTRRLPPGGLDPLAGHEIVQREDDVPYSSDELAEALAHVDAVVCTLTDRIGEHELSKAAGLKVVANVAVGYDNIDLAAAASRHIVVCNTPGILDETTADLAFALILAATRRLGEAEKDLRAGRWSGWSLGDHLGRDVHGATLGLVGFGRIAQAVARRAEGFAMKVLHYARHPTGAAGYVQDLDELLAASDIVSLHVPLTPETHHLIDARRLSLMKPTAVLVNTARGAVVDEVALARALGEGQIYAAGIDVYENEPRVSPELLAAPNAVLLPHVGSASVETRTAMARMATSDVARVLAGLGPEHPVPL